MSPCRICGGKPKRDDRGEETHGISMGWWAALKCNCGVRLERFATTQGSDLYDQWEKLNAA